MITNNRFVSKIGTYEIGLKLLGVPLILIMKTLSEEELHVHRVGFGFPPSFHTKLKRFIILYLI